MGVIRHFPVSILRGRTWANAILVSPRAGRTPALRDPGLALLRWGLFSRAQLSTRRLSVAAAPIPAHNAFCAAHAAMAIAISVSRRERIVADFRRVQWLKTVLSLARGVSHMLLGVQASGDERSGLAYNHLI